MRIVDAATTSDAIIGPTDTPASVSRPALAAGAGFVLSLPALPGAVSGQRRSA